MIRLSSIIILSGILTALSLPAAAGQGDNFTKILDGHRMIFQMPDNYTETEVKKNEDVSYEFAVKSKKNKLEIRYAVFSLIQDVKEYQEWKNSKNKNGVTLDPNTIYEMFSFTVAANIAGSESFKKTVFDSESVKNEFNADWGASYLVECKSEFGKGYKYALITALHKDDVANAYIIFLFDDFDVAQSEIKTAFYSMKFMTKYFNTRSILYSSAYILSSLNKTKITPEEIGAKINYNENDRNIDDYLRKIAKAYSLKLTGFEFKDVKDIARVVKLANESSFVIIIYGNQNVNHSAVVFGYKVDSGNLLFRIFDSTYKDEDIIDASTMTSRSWRLKAGRAYYFSR